MKITVVGPGAMGCLFAVRLQRAGHEVTLLDRDESRARRLAKNGITLVRGEQSDTVQLPVTTRPPAAADLYVVLTKAHATQSLELPGDAPVLTLQNGLGNVEALCGIAGSQRLLAGTTSEAATLLDEGHVSHAAEGLTTFGSWTSCECEPHLDAFREAGFNVELSTAPGQSIWEKTAINAGINPLTALLNVPNGKLLEDSETRQLLRSLVVEAAKIAAMEGYHFHYSLVEHAEQVCHDTRDNISSMLQDVRAGRRTEIEAISGEILRRSEDATLPVPRTRVVYQLVRGLERFH